MENSQDYISCCVLDKLDIKQAIKIINMKYNEGVKQSSPCEGEGWTEFWFVKQNSQRP